MSKSKKSDKQTEATVGEMRRSLKELMKREIANLPDLIEQLPPSERIKYVFRMMPFVLPTVTKVNPRTGEDITFGNWNTYDD